MGFMIRSLTGKWKFWIYFDIDMKLVPEEIIGLIGDFESTGAIVKSITCDQAQCQYDTKCYIEFWS